MRSKMLGIITAGALLFGVAGQAQADVLQYDGTLFISVGTLPPMLGIASGVATIDGSSATSYHINTISFDGGLTATATIPLTDPDNSTLNTLVGNATLPTVAIDNNLSGISGGAPIGPDNLMALGGQFTICILAAGCQNTLPIPITINGTIGAGLGGTFTVNTYADVGLKLSIEAAPWTIGVASIKSVTTDMSPANCSKANPPCNTVASYITNSVRSGFAHGPASATSNTGALSGRLQLVTPTRVTTSLNPPSATLAVWGILTLQTIPEPGLAILLASGVAGLVLLGRQRMRK